jgi:hypothetical protein
MDKSSAITLTIILAVVIFAVYLITQDTGSTNEELIKCIGEKSTLYIQLGCHACETQENMFGDNYNLLNVVDCFYDRDECVEKGIEATPTWIINGEKFRGVQTIDTLKDRTDC